MLASSLPHAPSAPPDLSDQTILLVDDDAVSRLILAGTLADKGYRVIEAESGGAALELFRREHPLLLLMDVEMPGKDGFAICREILEEAGEHAPPVIFLTTRGEQKDIVEGFASGGSDYVMKTASEAELLARVKTHLTNRRLVAQLAAANRKKNEFLGMAAHDLRNPLSNISGLAGILLEGLVGDVTEDQASVLRDIRNEGAEMLRLVTDLLDISTIEAGVLQLRLESCCLEDVIRRSIEINSPQARKKSTAVTFHPTETFAEIPADPGKVRQVVDNLISNAVKYSPLGSTIRVVCDATGNDFLRVSVTDQGPGIPIHERHLLFREFGRLSTRATGGEKSTGLGLAICRRVIEAHGGEIGVISEPGQGSTFWFTLPRNVR